MAEHTCTVESTRGHHGVRFGNGHQACDIFSIREVSLWVFVTWTSYKRLPTLLKGRSYPHDVQPMRCEVAQLDVHASPTCVAQPSSFTHTDDHGTQFILIYMRQALCATQIIVSSSIRCAPRWTSSRAPTVPPYPPFLPYRVCINVPTPK